MHLTDKELSHDEDLKNSTKIEVLGLPTPIFFGQNLIPVDDEPDSVRSKQLVTRPMFNSVVWACILRCGEEDTTQSCIEHPLGEYKVEAENLLHYFT